jgi:hypothetical protein
MEKQVADANILPLSTLWAKVDWVVVGHPRECNPPYTRTRKWKNKQKRNVWFSAVRYSAPPWGELMTAAR